jgi:GxxExxY protein
MKEDDVAAVIVDAALKIHTSVGPGLLESVYERILAYELQERGLTVERQVTAPLVYGRLTIRDAYRADLLVEGCVIVELKSTEDNAPVHKKQLLTYLKIMGLRLGLLINFGMPTLKQGITRLVNGLPE